MKRWAGLVWLLAGVSEALLGLNVLQSLSSRTGRPEDVVWLAAWAGFPIAGAVVASRRPRHPVGWNLMGIGFCVSGALLLYAYAERAYLAGQRLARPDVAALVGQLLFIAGIALVATLVLLFPSGRLPSDRWRWPSRVGAAVFGLLFVVYAVRSVVEVGDGVRVPNPIGVAAVEAAVEALIPLLFASGVLFTFFVIGHAVFRFVRARGTERQQLKWFVFAAALFPVLMGVAVPLGTGVLGSVFAISAWVLSLNGMAAGVAVAVLRYRLYDIDRVISRTVAYSLVVLFLFGTYSALVVALQSATARLAGGTDFAVAASTLAAAALFMPVTRRVRDAVDRRFNRSRYDAAHTIDVFSARLRDEIDLDALKAEVEDVVSRTMHPAHVSLWAAPAFPRRA